MNYVIDQLINQGTPQAYGTDATGQDTYATVLTTTADRHHAYIYNSGTHPAVISFDGTTDMFYVPGQTALTLDGLAIPSGTTVKAKNGSAGNNYTGLYLSMW